MTQAQVLNQKRRYFHQLLIALGEEKYKDVIVSAKFGTETTTGLTAKQLDELIAEARQRLFTNKKPAKADNSNAEIVIKKWRNKCLLVLNERGIIATPKDWSAVNDELAKKQYQWVLTPAQTEQGIVNYKGLYAFGTAEQLKKLFNQLVAIRDAERAQGKKFKNYMLKN